MPDHTDQITARLDHVAAQLVAALAAHEEEDHAGEPCRQAKVSALGYLAFRLGMKSEGELLLVAHHCMRFQATAGRKVGP